MIDKKEIEKKISELWIGSFNETKKELQVNIKADLARLTELSDLYAKSMLSTEPGVRDNYELAIEAFLKRQAKVKAKIFMDKMAVFLEKAFCIILKAIV